MQKTVRLGTIKQWEGGRWISVYCRIEYKDGKLSISGVEGPLPSGNCLGSCGQIDMHLRAEQSKIKLAPGWTRAKLAKFFEVWKKWHLNDMRAGTPEQMAELAKHDYSKSGNGSHYLWACDVLDKAGLLTVPNPTPAPQDAVSRQWPSTYKYGSAWLREEVPADVIEFLMGLPNSDRTPAWV